MHTLHIINIPYSDLCCDYYRFFLENRTILNKYSIRYINTKKFFYDIESHQYISTLISHFIQNKDKISYQRVEDALKYFEMEAQKDDKQDLLLAFDVLTPNTLIEFCNILIKKTFPTLRTFKFNIINILSPQHELFEGSYRFCKPLIKQDIQNRKNRYINSIRCNPDSLYREAEKICEEPPHVLLAEYKRSLDAASLLHYIAPHIPVQEIKPVPDTRLEERHSLEFIHTFETNILLRELSYEKIAVALRQLGQHDWNDAYTWTPPEILQEIRKAATENNRRLARRIFHREELFQCPAPISEEWAPYGGLPPALRITIMQELMRNNPCIRMHMNHICSCRWQYAALPPEEKQLFPDPNAPQVLAREPLVSVLTLTRNQASMIAENMESVLAQQTRFPFQHIIVDDGSDDGTQDIITEYAARYPLLIKPILLKSKAPDGENVRALFEQCRSKYAVLCDGDDYFTDPGKLQMQVDFMERNPDCALCFHPVSVVYEDGSPTKIYPPTELLPGGEHLWYSLRNLLTSNFIQTNSVMYRWRFQNGLPDWFDPTLIPGDWYWHLLHAETGKIAYLRKPMSAYRRHAASLYARAEKDHVAHRHAHGLNELKTYSVCNAHFHGRYYKDFSRLARGVFADFVQDYLKTKDDSLLQKGIAAAPDFARDFLSLLASQNMELPPKKI